MAAWTTAGSSRDPLLPGGSGQPPKPNQFSVTKQDIANTLVKKTELTQTQALALTNQFFDQIIETLKSGEEIKLSSFGNFVVRNKTPRPGRNPKTGEEVMISARKVVTFKAGPKLKLATKKGKK